MPLTRPNKPYKGSRPTHKAEPTQDVGDTPDGDKKGAANPPAADTPAKPAPSIQPKAKAKKVKAPSAKVATPRPAVTASDTAASETISHRVVVPFPVEGASTYFDLVAERYGTHRAMRLILDQLFEGLAQGMDIGGIEAEPLYPGRPDQFRTNRFFPIKAFETCRKALDPLGLERENVLGRMIGHGLMSRFLRLKDAEQSG